MKKENFLALDSEMGKDELVFAIQGAYHSGVNVTVVEDVVSFRKLAKKSLYEGVYINFGMSYFCGMSFSDVRKFVKAIKDCRGLDFKFIGATGNYYLKNKLEKLGVSTFYKICSVQQIGMALGTFKDIKDRKKSLSLEDLHKIICEYYDTPYHKILENTRKRDICRSRHVIAYLAHKFIAGITLDIIGEYLGGRDHTTVIHSCQTVRDWMDTDEAFKSDIQNLISSIAA